MANATLTPVSESEYLHSAYEADVDYIDGELQERNVGELSHGILQGLLITLFNINRRAWGVFAGTEVRVRVSARKYRIPDVCVLRKSDTADPIVQKAPLICIEVLSPEDRMHRIQERFDDYARMGVENLWLIDPVRRHAWVVGADGSQLRVTEAFTVEGTPIRISLAAVFAELDDMQSGA
jgi:Uma2 family endonuclease